MKIFAGLLLISALLAGCADDAGDVDETTTDTAPYGDVEAVVAEEIFAGTLAESAAGLPPGPEVTALLDTLLEEQTELLAQTAARVVDGTLSPGDADEVHRAWLEEAAEDIDAGELRDLLLRRLGSRR